MQARKSALFAIIGAVSLVAPMAALAQQQQRPPEPPIAEMAKDLGVSEAVMKACMPKMEPGAQGGEQAAPQKPDASAIASCLTQNGTKVDAKTVDATMGKFAPKQPKKN